MKRISPVFLVTWMLLTGLPFLQGQSLDPHYAPIGNSAFQTGVWSSGHLFLPPWLAGDTLSGEGFAYPADSASATALMAGLWIGGLDASGQLHLSVQDHHVVQGTGRDFWPGPLTAGTAATDSATMALYNQHWRLTRSELDAFLTDFADNGIIDSPQLYPQVMGWPAFGPDASGQVVALAPFVDMDGDPGSYDPMAGDHPRMWGSEMLWGISNDTGGGGARHTAAPALGLEVQQTLFVMECDTSPLSQALFVRYELINRSNQTLQDVRIGMWTDPDIGQATNDFVGVDTSRSLMYAYNGTPSDPVYGQALPAMGVGLLQGPLAPAGDGLDNDRDGQVDETGERYHLTHFVGHLNDFSTYLGNPLSPDAYYAYLHGNDLTGSPLVDNYSNGGAGTGLSSDGPGPSLPYLFPGEACSGSGWTPANAGLAPTDWRMVGTTGPISLAPGQRETLVFQFSVARAPSGMPDEAVCLLQDLADDLRQLHALEYVGCQLDGLVFPGDANHDQVANAWDLLSLGVAFGASGPARPQASLGWQGQIAPLWGQSLASGVDFRHVDTDGDGNITWADTLAINLNYGLVHASNKNQANGGVPLLIDMNIGTANPGDTLRFPIELGTADTMGVDVYGLAFQLEYDTAMVLPGSLGLDMGQSWLGTKGNDLLTILHQDHSRGTIDIGMVRNDHLPRTNYGPIGSLIVVLDDDIAKRLQPLTLSFVQANLIDPNEQDIPLAPRNNSLDIQTSLSNDWPADLAVFPNPAQSALYFRSARPDLREAQLIHPNGQLVAQKTWGLPAGELSWILPSLPSGLYFLRVRTQTGIHCRSMVIE